MSRDPKKFKLQLLQSGIYKLSMLSQNGSLLRSIDLTEDILEDMFLDLEDEIEDLEDDTLD